MKKEYRIVPSEQSGRYIIQTRTLKGAVKTKWTALPTIYSSRMSAEEAIKNLPQ